MIQTINFFPSKFLPYIKIMRMHSPIGAILLMLPPMWALVLSSPSKPKIWMFCVFILGAILTRSAGCIINDIFDRNIDKQVERTQNRPLANGDLNLKQALILLGIVLFCAFCLLLTLSKLAILIGIFSIIPISLYPLTKRFINIPQVFLGFTFNIGTLLAWAAIRGKIEIPALFLYIGSVFWTIGYDTIYAHQDKIDDEKIGVNSSALYFEKKSNDFITFCYKICSISLILAALTSRVHISIYLFIPFLILYWQVKEVDLNSSKDCLLKFNSNAIFGLLILIVFYLTKFR